MIGITAVVAVINTGQSFKQFIVKQVEVFGTDYIQIEIKVPAASQTSSENVMGMVQGVEITTLKYEDGLEIRKNPNISDVYMGLMGQEIISRLDTNKVGLLWGVSDGYFRIDKTKIEYGRAFTEDEERSQAMVVILGHEIKRDLFGDEDAIGEKVKIGNAKYKVIGTREKMGNTGFMNMDDMIIVPIRTLQKKIMGIDHISFIVAKVIDMSYVEQSVAEIIDIMREQHDISDPNKDDFAVMSSVEAMNMLNNILNGVALLLVAIASISLLVGGVGIMNIMYVSVLERTYEIGLRKAIGATGSDIMTQFLAEAVLITATGGVGGVLLGIGLSMLISAVATAKGFGLEPIVSIPGIITAGVFMILVGLIFGIYPAKKAAGMDPVEALRYE